MKKNHLSKRYSITKTLASLVILCSLCLTDIVFANPLKGPKGGSSPRNPTIGNGNRGGCSYTKETLTVLNSIYGKTVSNRPVLSWFVPDIKSYPMELYLYEYSENGYGKEIFEKIPLESQFGIMNYTFSEKIPSLSVGKKYIWQIALICDKSNPSKDVIAEAVFEVVDIPENLKNQLERAKNNRERAELYAKFGFWYDALAEIENETKNREFQFSLLEKIKQSEIEGANNLQGSSRKDLEDQAQRLQLVIDVEKQKRQ
ncbi:MAG: DUF928 domain-containing protein [Richelia sp. RM2_1_2]|nr:DUF928 domain-containing protein [Richelia sp. SM2_1_7]NJM22359.1 DUF928 domain-containing protein [Richelia sp. SM1_7_0]NJO63892.1 DUF928 domain-containing protein [Richelia sp. RM2_1_2]